VQTPGAPHQLPNRHTVLTSQGNTNLVELNAAGKVVSEVKGLPYQIFRICGR
jgi:hypothetical protein